MTIRAYLSHACPPESRSVRYKRELIQLERKNVERVLFRPGLSFKEDEDGDLMVVYGEDGKEEMFDCHLCDVEVLKNEPTDGLTDGLELPY